MRVDRPHEQPLTDAERSDLERLRQHIEREIAGGHLSRDAIDAIYHDIAADGKVSHQELDLYRQLVLDAIDRGELTYDW